MATVHDVLQALDTITGGRCLKNTAEIADGRNRFVISKTSDIPGKACLETPGLIYGNLAAPVKKIAVTMTLTECNIELAAATGVDAIVAHHPIMDAANSGGVTLRNYLDLYGISVFELHEAFHGLHPGIAFIHGHQSFRVDISYGGIPGNVLYVGKALQEVGTLGDILDRLNAFMGFDEEHALLQAERQTRCCSEIMETNVALSGEILAGSRTSAVSTVIHVFPHSGFTPEHLIRAKSEHPEADTLLMSISRVRQSNPLVTKAQELGMNVIAGNSHAMEILENGLPLAVAIHSLLPETDVVLFRERITSTPIARVGTKAVRAYAAEMAERFLLPQEGGGK